MKRRYLGLAAATFATLLMAPPVIAYDHDGAAAYAQMFASVQGPKAGKELHFIKPEQFVNEVRGGTPFATLDVRTPGETRFLTGNLPGNLVIPLNELFEPQNLAKLPTVKPIVVLCKSGARATAVAMALRSIGFDETYVLKGGFKGLIAYLGAKEANQPLGPKTAGR